MGKQLLTKQDYLGRLHHVIKQLGGNEAAAKIMDKSVKSIERYKRGADIPLEAAYALASAAGASIDWLTAGACYDPDPTGFSDKYNVPEEDPFIQDPAMVEIMASRRITPQMVEDAVRYFLEHLIANDETIHPASTGRVISILCQMGSDEGGVTMKTVERLMKIRENG